jgi:SM-20-related protein
MQILHSQLNTVIEDLIKNGYAICEGFLPAHTIKALADKAEKRYVNGEMVAAKTGKNTNTKHENFRNDSIYWLDEASLNTSTQDYFKQINLLKTVLNQHFFMSLHDMETHLAVYPIGGVYLRHLDQFKQTNFATKQQRKISSVLYLNDNWLEDEGGELRLYLNDACTNNTNNYIDILPNAGRLVLFLSADFWHEVLPATRNRISLTGWFRTR